MDRDDLIKRIHRTEDCIQQGQRRIHAQQIKIHRMELRGEETKFAIERLEELQSTQQRYEQNWHSLLDALRK